MKKYSNQWAIVTMARVLRVSSSGYYKWLKFSGKESKTATLDVLVHSEYLAGKKKVGYRKVRSMLKDNGCFYSLNTIQRSMQRQGLKAMLKRRFCKTTDSNHTLLTYPNRLNRNFVAALPNQKWVGDITYIWTKCGWVYLATYLDLCTRKIVGWAMSENIDAELACSALKDALVREGYPIGVMVYTDRGSTYCSEMYRSLISDFLLTGSMSRRGNCWDNAVSESLFSTYKREVDGIGNYANKQEAYNAAFEFIECWYNVKRPHSSIGYQSPLNYEKKLLSSHQLTV
jgi:transposase InsO family protein